MSPQNCTKLTSIALCLVIFSICQRATAQSCPNYTIYNVDFNQIPAEPLSTVTTTETVQCPLQPPQTTQSTYQTANLYYHYPGSFSFGPAPNHFGWDGDLFTVLCDKSKLDGLSQSFQSGFTIPPVAPGQPPYNEVNTYHIDVAGALVVESLTTQTSSGLSSSTDINTSSYDIASGIQTISESGQGTTIIPGGTSCAYNIQTTYSLAPTPIQWVVNPVSGSTLPPPMVDLQVDEISFTQGFGTAPDDKPYVNPGIPAVAQVVVSGVNATSSDSRSATVSLQVGSPPRSYSQTVALSSLANGAVTLSFPVTFLSSDAGDQTLTATINPTQSITEPSYANNASALPIHVFCDVAKNATRPVAVPFWSQFQSPWGGDFFGPYGGTYSPKHYMRGFGCYLSNIAMAAAADGITSTVSGLYIPVGLEVTSPPTGPLVELNPGTLNKAGSLEKFNGQYTMFSPGNDPNGYGIVNYARMAWAEACLAGGGSAADCSQNSLKQMTFKGDLVTYDSTYVKTQICMGNPIILELAIPAVPATPTTKAKKAHSHFVLATAMDVDPQGNASYFINDPGKSAAAGKHVELFDKYPQAVNPVVGQRVYLHAADPSFFQVLGESEKFEYVVTDPSGRRTGFNPFTNESFAEIPGAVYYKHSSPNEDPTDLAPDQPGTTFMVNAQAAVEGTYTIDIYATASGSAKLRVEGYDAQGTLNQMLPISQNLTKGKHTQVTYVHSAQTLTRATLDLRNAAFIDRAHDRDDSKILLAGKFALPAGSPTIGIDQSVTFSVGTFSLRIPASDFKVHREDGGTVYIYESRREEESRVLIKSDGSFIAEIYGAKIERSELLQSMQIDVQIDSAYGTAMVNLKAAGRDECRRHDEEFFEYRDDNHDSDGRKSH